MVTLMVIFKADRKNKSENQGRIGFEFELRYCHKEHNGTIKVQSKKDEGSDFIIQLSINA